MVQFFLTHFVEVKRWQDFKKPKSQGEKGSFFGFEGAFEGTGDNGYPGGIFDPMGMSRSAAGLAGMVQCWRSYQWWPGLAGRCADGVSAGTDALACKELCVRTSQQGLLLLLIVCLGCTSIACCRRYLDACACHTLPLPAHWLLAWG